MVFDEPGRLIRNDIVGIHVFDPKPAALRFVLALLPARYGMSEESVDIAEEDPVGGDLLAIPCPVPPEFAPAGGLELVLEGVQLPDQVVVLSVVHFRERQDDVHQSAIMPG